MASSQHLGWWLFRKTLPALMWGAIIGVCLGFLAHKSPNGFRGLQIVAALIFFGIFILYSYWASNRKNSGGYVWHPLQRMGIFCSGIGALLLSLKLGFPALAGSLWIYAFLAFLLAFVIRPILDHLGWKRKFTQNGEKQLS